MKPISRREFSSGLVAGTAGFLIGGCSEEQPPVEGGSTPRSQRQSVADASIQRHASLGTTGITVSDVIFGGGVINSPGLIRYAFDRGVNTFDTAAKYGLGVSEEIIGRGLDGVRDRAHIITKQGFRRHGRPDLREMTRTLEASLRNLRTDYVDGLLIHSMESMDALQDDDVLEAFARFKRQGTVRFTGFSTHNERRTLSRCVEPRYEDVVDAVMLRYNHMEGSPIEPLIAALHAKGIGTIAMKTLAGGQHGRLRQFVNDRMSYPQAAIAWVLSNENVDCAVLSMDTYSLVDTYVAASGKSLERSDNALLRRYRGAVDQSYCRVTCTSCESACPNDVAISDIMRFAMYSCDYGHHGKALRCYASLAGARKPLRCATCSGPCVAACKYGLPVKDNLLRAHLRLSA